MSQGRTYGTPNNIIAPSGGRSPLPGSGETEKIELLSAALGKPVPLCYGKHIVGGNVIYQSISDVDQLTTYFIALGEGEWDGIETIWVDGEEHAAAAVALMPEEIHLHPGTDGEASAEVANYDPMTFAAGQKICSFWPTAFTPRLTFSRLAYLAIKMEPDPERPDLQLDIRGVYRTKKVRTFDSSGAQLTYAYSANPAWIILDLLVSRWLKPHGLINEALTDAEKALIDFPTFATAAAYCDADEGDGAARYEAHVAFTDQTNLASAINQVLMLMSGYLIDLNGKMALYCDTTRTSVLTIDRSAIAEGTLSFPRKDTRDLANKIRIKYRSLVSGDVESPRNPAKDFQSAAPEFSDHQHQDDVGRIIPAEIDIGNSTPHRADRIGRYLRNRSLYLVDQLQGTLMPANAAASSPIDLLPGDIVTAPTDVDAFFSKDYEVLEISDNPDGSRDAFAQEYAEDEKPTLTPGVINYDPDPGPLEHWRVPKDLEVFATPQGLGILAGVRARENTINIDKAEIRYFIRDDSLGPPPVMVIDMSDLYAISQETQTTYLVGHTFMAANDGANFMIQCEAQSMVWFAFRLHNEYGWSLWTDGNRKPWLVSDHAHTTDPAYADDGGAAGHVLVVEVGPTPDTVVLRLDRPPTNAECIHFLHWVIYDKSTGSNYALDSGSGPSVVYYDGSAIDHTINIMGNRFTRDSGSGFGTASVGDQVLVCPAGAAFAVNNAMEFWIARFEGDDPATATWFETTTRVAGDGTNPTLAVKLKIVKPVWEWATNGYIGSNGWVGEDFWEIRNSDGSNGDKSTRVFKSPPIRFSPITLENVGGRVWVHTAFACSDGGVAAAGPVRKWDMTNTTDSGQPAGAHDPVIKDSLDDDSIPVDHAVVEFYSDDVNGESVFAVEVVAGPSADVPFHGPYRAQLIASGWDGVSGHAGGDVLYSGSGLAIRAGDRTIILTVGTPPDCAGKILLVHEAGSDLKLDGNYIMTHGASTLYLYDAFAKSGTFSWEIVEPWYGQNAADGYFNRGFSVPDDMEIWGAPGTLCRTKPFPAPEGAIKATLYRKNVYGASETSA